MQLYPISDPRSFAIPIMIAVAIQGVILLVLSTHWMNNEQPTVKTVPSHIAARVVQLEPAKPKKKNVKKEPKKQAAAQSSKVKAPEKTSAKVPAKAVEQNKAAELAKALADKQALLEKNKQEQLREAARQAALNELDDLLSDELAARKDASDSSSKDEEVVADYASQIRALIERVWRVPPSAKHTDTVLVQIHLVPTGEVTEVQVLESSNNPALDRSAEQAVWKVAVLPVPKDPIIFEKKFRRLNLKLTPENARL